MPVNESGHYCCLSCGTVRSFKEKEILPTRKLCSGEEWMKAVK